MGPRVLINGIWYKNIVVCCDGTANELTLSLTNLSTQRQRIAELARTKRGVALSTLRHVIDLEWMKEPIGSPARMVLLESTM